jgi:Uma2 family endonuclease
MRSVGDDAVVSVQNPVILDERNEPQPDLTVIRPRDYRISLPSPEGVLLPMEVSDTDLPYDRNVTLPLYARAGIEEVWIADLPGGTIERHTDPSEDGYRGLERARRAETMGSVELPDLALTVDDVLG